MAMANIMDLLKSTYEESKENLTINGTPEKQNSTY